MALAAAPYDWPEIGEQPYSCAAFRSSRLPQANKLSYAPDHKFREICFFLDAQLMVELGTLWFHLICFFYRFQDDDSCRLEPRTRPGSPPDAVGNLDPIFGP